jgi:wobble nucleotide-excising tRNase
MDTARSGDLNIQIRSSKEENYAAKAETAGKEILHKHKGQLRQLVHMLKHIETQVNSHREDILQMVDDRRTFFQEFIQKSLYYLSSVHSQNHDTFPVTVKLLRVLFNNINEVLGSVDTGVNDFMQALAKNMCHPMTKYVGNLAAEIKHGPCVQLMNVVNEMERSNSDTRRELQDARERIRLAEETKINALSKLKKAEDQVQRMTTSAKFLLPASQKKQAEHSITGKRIGTEGSREHEEKLLWELLSKRRKQQEPESPMGPKELIRQSDTKQKTLVYNRRRTRSQALLSSQTARPDALIPLGLSPSARTVTWR